MHFRRRRQKRVHGAHRPACRLAAGCPRFRERILRANLGQEILLLLLLSAGLLPSIPTRSLPSPPPATHNVENCSTSNPPARLPVLASPDCDANILLPSYAWPDSRRRLSYVGGADTRIIARDLCSACWRLDFLSRGSEMDKPPARRWFCRNADAAAAGVTQC